MKFKRYKNESIKLDSKLRLDESVFKDYSIEDTPDFVDTVDQETPFDNKCEKCNALLTDGGTCPVCDDGEEDYTDLEEACADYRVKRYGAYWFGITGPDGLMLRDETDKLRLFKTSSDAQNFIDTQCGSLTEELTNLEKLKRAFPELNFNKEGATDELTESSESLSVRERLKARYPELNFDDTTTVMAEELSNKEKLKRAYPELNLGDTSAEDLTEELSNREKLKAAFPELNFEDTAVNENITTEDIDEDPYRDYDDDYDDLDDVEQDRRHAALYGGDRMYCDCGTKLKMTEWGGYCPKCEPEIEFDSDVED